MSDKYYYAGYNGYGTSFTYDSDGWMVHAFKSKKERDDWVKADNYPNGNPTRENITAETAYKLNSDLRTQPVQNVANAFYSNVVLHE